jgi:hypothetical protein
VERDEELRAKHRITTVAGTSGAAIAYDYKPCQSIAVREVAIGSRRDCRAVARDGTTLYVAVHGGGIAVLDIADPRAVQITSTFAMPNAELVDLALAGKTLYAADHVNGVHALDVSDPKQLRHLALHPALAAAQNRRVLVDGNLLVLVNDHAFSLFDVEKPFRPLGTHNRLRTAVGWLRGAVLEGKRLHVTQGPMGVWTFDLSDPAKPRPIAGQEVRLDTRPNERLITDTLAHHAGRLFAGTSSGIWVLKLPESGAPESELFFTGPGTIREPARAAVRDGQLYFCAFEPHDHVFFVFDTAQGVRYLGRQRLSRMIDRIYDLQLGDGFWIAAAGNAGVLLATP